MKISNIKRIIRFVLMLIIGIMLQPLHAHASMFHGETLDKVADGISWVVIILVPIIGVIVFLMIHILPEKVAEKRKHPQARAIQVLCLLSLVFGGILWPLAWLWAYSKPVLYKMAYGTDVAELEEDEKYEHHQEEKMQAIIGNSNPEQPPPEPPPPKES